MEKLLHRNIYLSGFRAAGKTTLGPILAGMTGFEFFDLEQGIEEVEGRPLSEVESEAGEFHVSRLERSILQKHFWDGGAVVALTHSTVVNPGLLDLLNRSGIVITLHAPLEVIIERLHRRGGGDIETLSDGAETPEEGVGRLLYNRRYYYRRADAVLPTHLSGPVTVARHALSVVLAMQAESKMVI